MTKKSTQCSTNDCDGKVLACGLCSACYSWAHYHKSQGVAATQAYLKRQRRVAARIEQHLPTRKVARPPARAQYAGRAYVN